MSLYNYLFGVNENADVLLGVIGFTMEDFGRFRDIFLNPEGTVITVLTRLGGNNRKEYETYISNARNNDLYIKDYDDDYDSTYAYFEFSIPEKYQKMCKNIAPKEKRKSLHDMFENELKESEKPGTPAYYRAQNLAKELSNSLKDDNGRFKFFEI